MPTAQHVDVVVRSTETPPIIVAQASRDDVPLGVDSVWFAWTEQGRFQITNVKAKSWHTARALGAAKLGALVEHVDAAREVKLAPVRNSARPTLSDSCNAETRRA